MHEFDLIRHLFMHSSHTHFPVGNGDDCAVFPLLTHNLAVSTDTMVESVHFFPSTDPYLLGQKLLAVNLSDLAAMGAQPVGCTLSMSVPSVELPWLEAFAQGFLSMAQTYGCPLVGGDTVRSPSEKQFTVTIFGEVDAQRALRRNQAQCGDDIWVSGVLGGADIALKILQERLQLPDLLTSVRRYLEQPVPRVALGRSLLGLAHAAIDLSDGLYQDLGHILHASQVGACLYLEQLPMADGLKECPLSLRLESALYGGDVYELCFTAPAARHSEVQILAQSLAVSLTCIGHIQAEQGLQLQAQSADMQEWIQSHAGRSTIGYQHF